jgi:hypothetical protein
MTYKRIGKYWHRLDAVIEGRQMTFFGFSKDEVFEKAESRIRDRREYMQLVAAQEQSNVIDFTVARRGA